MGVKHSYEFVKNVFEQKGCQLLSKNYISSEKKLDYVCSKHSNIVQSISFLNFYNNNRGCQLCGIERRADKQRHSFDFVKKEFENRNYILISNTYVNSGTSLQYICKEHPDKVQKICYDSLKNGSGCKLCGNSRIAEKLKHSYKYVKEFFNKKGYELLDDVYINGQTNMYCICRKHSEYIQQMKFNKLQQGHGCKYCAKESIHEKQSYSYDYVFQCFQDKGFELLSENYINNQQKLDYICLKHLFEIQQTTFADILTGKYICKHCHSEGMSGQNNPSWNENLTDEERIFGRKLEDYKKWRFEVYKKDCYTCQCCKKVGGKLNAHHLCNYADYPALRTDVNNGITLCKKCHIEFHKVYGKRNTTKEQFEEFVKLKN
jgi:hypothetical protein